MKLGAQCQEKGEAIYKFNQVVHPNNIKAINVVDLDFWQRIWAENPRLEYAIFRKVPNGPDPFADPEGAALSWVAHLKGEIGHLVDEGLVNLVEGYNEWVHSFQADLFPAADRFMATVIDETHKQFGGKAHAIVLNASCGHFNDTDITSFPKTLKKLNECSDCKLGLHSYDRDNMDRMYPHLCGKFQLVEKGLKEAGFPNVRIAITEVGLDAHVESANPHGGWLIYGNTVEEAVAHYLNEHNLGWYYPLLMESNKVDLASIFGCQMHYSNDWGEWGFDIRQGFPSLLYGIRDLGPDPDPDPEPEPEEEMVTVYGENGVLLEGAAADDLVARHGLSWEMPEGLQPGDHFYNLKALRFKTGNVAFIYRVRDLDGGLIANPDEEMDRSKPHRAWWWPDVCGANDIVTHYPTDYDACADLGGLNENGEGGSPIDAWHDPYKPGPYRAWVRHPTIPSVILKGIGMVGSTNHDHMDGEWQEEVYGNGEDPEPPVDGDLVQVDVYEREGTPTFMFGIAYPLDISIDTRGSGVALGVDVTLHPDTWQHPVTSKDYALVEMCCDFVGDASRQYTIQVYQMSDNKVLAEDTIMVGPLGTPRKQIVSIFEYGEPEPEPPAPSDHAARLRMVADGVYHELYQIADDLSPGGIKQITVEYDSGVSQIFKPMANLGTLVSNLIRRLKWS